MNQDIEVTLIVENGPNGEPTGGGARLRFPPRQGDYITHETGEGECRLYRVIAVVIPSNPDSDLQTFDVHVLDEGAHQEALARVLAQQSASLTRVERLLLRNQHQVLARLEPDEASWHQEASEVLEQGFEPFYEEYLGQVTREVLNPDVARLVFDVLNMYSALQDYIERTNDVALANKPWAALPGFDGNEEAAHLNFATFVLEGKGRYRSLHPAWQRHGGNSHHNTLGVYQRMLAVWRALPVGHYLSTADAHAICDAV